MLIAQNITGGWRPQQSVKWKRFHVRIILSLAELHLKMQVYKHGTDEVNEACKMALSPGARPAG